jgi:hypothetical protein
MGLFELLFGPGATSDWYTADDPGRAQAAADYIATAGGWSEPTPPNLGRDFDPAQDGGWW